MKAEFIRKHSEATNITTFWFKPEQPIDYIAGQYVEMWLPHDQPDSLGSRRWFTLSSSPTDAPLVSITTKLSGQSSSFKKALTRLSNGDRVNLTDGMGDFVLPKQTDRQLIFVAGGIELFRFIALLNG